MRFTARKQDVKNQYSFDSSPAPADQELQIRHDLSRSPLDTEWTDAALVEALKLRNSDAVRYAVETYAPKLYRYAVYQCGDIEAAEDVAAEVMARMLEKIDGYNYTGAPFQTWLFSIARNLISDMYRRNKKANLVSLEGDGASEALEIGRPDSTLDGLADRDALMQAMKHLTDEQRQIVTLRLVEGWEPAEIAQLLGKSIDSVKSLQYRALQTMKRLLEPGG